MDAAKPQGAARKTLAAGDTETFRRSVHTLKSNGANFGAKALAALCQELENQARAGTVEGAAESLARIEAEYGRARLALETVRKELSG